MARASFGGLKNLASRPPICLARSIRPTTGRWPWRRTAAAHIAGYAEVVATGAWRPVRQIRFGGDGRNDDGQGAGAGRRYARRRRRAGGRRDGREISGRPRPRRRFYASCSPVVSGDRHGRAVMRDETPAARIACGRRSHRPNGQGSRDQGRGPGDDRRTDRPHGFARPGADHDDPDQRGAAPRSDRRRL